MYAVRLWSVRHARGLGALLSRCSSARCVAARPLLRRIGYERLEAPAAAVERNVKGLLFDCQMCGQCVLSSTGMSCPMNCPKQMRNGPCGGVRADGHCEVKPEMRCVWVAGLARLARGCATARPRSRRCSRRSTIGSRGSSAWLAVARENGADARRRDDLRATSRSRAIRCRSCRATPRAAGSSACCAPARSRSPPSSTRRIRPTRDDVYRPRARCSTAVDAINAIDGSGAQVPHVERRHLRAADPRRLCPRHADLLPRQEPHRDPGRRPGRRRDGRRQHPVPHRRRRAGGDQPQAKPVFDLDCITLLQTVRTHARRAPLPVRPQADLAAARVPRRGRQSVRAAARLAPAPSRQEDRGRRAVRPDAVLLRRAAAAALHGAGRASWACTSVLHPGRRRAAALGQDRALDALERAGRPHSRRDRRAHRAGADDQAQRGPASALHRADPARSATIKGVHGVHVMAYRQEESVAEIITESGVLDGPRAVASRPQRRPATGESKAS